MHPHANMEILTYVLDGAMEHKDSMGNGSVIRPGDVQRMSAGTGVTHSEYNHSGAESVHFLQIWILPNAQGHKPGYEQKFFASEDKRGRLRLVASQTGRDGSVSLNQDADVYAGLFNGTESATFIARPGRDFWLHVARGSLSVNGQALDAGDGGAVSGPGELLFTNGQDAEVLLFDMAAKA